MRTNRRLWAAGAVALLAILVAVGLAGTTQIAQANHATDPDEMTITHSGGDPGPGGGGTPLVVPVGGTFTVEVSITTSTTDLAGWQWELAWLDALIDPVSTTQSPLTLPSPTCVAPTGTVVGSLEVWGVGAGCASLDPTFQGATMTGQIQQTTLKCVAPGVSLVALVDLGADPAFGATLLAPGGAIIPTTTENQLPNPLPPPPTIAAVVVSCAEPIDVSIVKSGPASLAAPATFTYSLDVTNPSSNAVTVNISDTAPAGVTFTSVSDPGCTQTASSVTCSNYNLSPGTTTITIGASVAASEAGTTKDNTATVTLVPVLDPSGLPVQVDPDSSNNSSTVSTSIAATAVSIAKSVDQQNITAGGSVTYTFMVCNGSGASEATNIAVTDSALGSVGTISSLAAGACDTLTAGPVTFMLPGQFCNTATADPDNGPAANSNQVCVNVAPNTPTKGIIDPSAARPLGNVWVCKSNSGQPIDCDLATITELIQMPDDVDACNDDDDGDGKGCADTDGDGISDSTDWDGDPQDLDTDGGELPEGLGAFEFQIKFDHKIFRHPVFDFSNTVLDDTGRVVNCTHQVVTENWVMVGCTSKDPTPGDGDNPAGPSVAAAPPSVLGAVTFPVQPDLKERIRPTKDNGARTDLLDENCQAADILGSPYNATVDALGRTVAPNGGLTDNCTDVTLTVRMLEGDVDLDCQVTVLDDQLIAFRYGATFGTLNYDQFFDLEPNTTPPDFDIDIKDLQFVFGRNGSTCLTPVPPQDPQPPIPDP